MIYGLHCINILIISVKECPDIPSTFTNLNVTDTAKRHFMDTNTLTCNLGYKLNDSFNPVVYCQSDGTWNVTLTNDTCQCKVIV